MNVPDSSNLPLSGTPESSGKGRQKSSHALLTWLVERARGVLKDEAPGVTSCQCPLPPKLGRFRLEGILGQGAYRSRFRAVDSTLERRVALKVAWPHVMFDRLSNRRFVNEPKAVASLDHPGIVRIYRYGWVGPLCYIALELIDGPTLSEWCKSQAAVPPRVAGKSSRLSPRRFNPLTLTASFIATLSPAIF